MDKTERRVVENYALSIANYFVELSQQDGQILRPLKLMKLVYIAHGYMLALLDRPTDGAKLERVEAWRYGPVFPSVYYSFKNYGRNPITDMTTVIDFHRLTEDGVFGEITPIIKDEDERAVCRFVWEKYAIYTDSSLVTILHAKDTPWSMYYEEGANKEIPDGVTKTYYKGIVKRTLAS